MTFGSTSDWKGLRKEKGTQEGKKKENEEEKSQLNEKLNACWPVIPKCHDDTDPVLPPGSDLEHLWAVSSKLGLVILY